MVTEITKACKKCGTAKPLSEYYLRKNRNNRPHSTCKICFNSELNNKKLDRLPKEKQDKIKQHRNQKAYLEQGKKQCLTCREVKLIDEYMTTTGTVKYSHCLVCRPLWEKQYFEKNPDKRKGRDKTRLKNRDLVILHTLPLKEAGCADCKKYYPDAMEFDHTCPTTEKFMDISRIHYLGESDTENFLNILKEELSKGEYVCVNCHRIRTAQRANNNLRLTYLLNPNSSLLNNLAKYVYEVLNMEKCIDCDENNFLVLEFDHVKGSKKANISTMIKKPTTFSLETVEEEIAKCEIRCGNCHRARTRARQIGEESTLQAPKNNTLKICECGSKKTLEALTCLECCNKAKASQSLDRYGDLDTLLTRLKASNLTQIGKELGVSGNAVKKYIQRCGINPKTLLPLEGDKE